MLDEGGVPMSIGDGQQNEIDLHKYGDQALFEYS